MTTPYTHLADVAAEVQPPEDGTLSRTLYNDDRVKVVLFGFSAGQELSDHTSSMPAVMHFLHGEAEVTLGEDRLTAGPGTWIHMPPNLRHSIRTRSPVVLLLLLLK
jgi:quercetin dioxygenase-like cupin family protein